MYKYVFFDLDGTLTDPGEGITNSVAHALRRFGIDVPPREELYKFIGPPLKESFGVYYGLSDSDCEKAVIYYREYYADKGVYENKVYEGIPELLQRVREMGMIPVLATSKPELFAHRILDHYDLKKYFAIVAGANLDNTRTKKDEVVGFAVNCICSDVKPSDIIMVGDRMHDVLGAAAHGIKCIGVTYGYGGEEELTSAGAAFIAHTPPEIGEILSKSL